MRRGSTISCAVAAVLVCYTTGCSQSDTPKQKAAIERPTAQPAREAKPRPRQQEKKYDVSVASAEGRAAPEVASPAKDHGEPNALPAMDEPLPLEDLAGEEPTMPEVVMSEAHAKLCKVRVGDAFPDLQLNDLAAEPRRLGDLLGKKLTVVAFWNAKQPMALDELAELGPRFDRRFAGDGVAVIAINSGDDPKLAKEVAEQARAEFVNLSDADGKALAAVGTAKLPRTYLLDAEGKIVWFDIEYSRTTRRELTQAIRYLVGAP